ncbi:MAG: hypothetical protein HYU36_04385 [Planctomycetes bacterium]|nr:hypothetical protein [Planctomycetota bacterium]
MERVNAVGMPESPDGAVEEFPWKQTVWRPTLGKYRQQHEEGIEQMAQVVRGRGR